MGDRRWLGWKVHGFAVSSVQLEARRLYQGYPESSRLNVGSFDLVYSFVTEHIRPSNVHFRTEGLGALLYTAGTAPVFVVDRGPLPGSHRLHNFGDHQEAKTLPPLARTLSLRKTSYLALDKTSTRCAYTGGPFPGPVSFYRAGNPPAPARSL